MPGNQLGDGARLAAQVVDGRTGTKPHGRTIGDLDRCDDRAADAGRDERRAEPGTRCRVLAVGRHDLVVEQRNARHGEIERGRPRHIGRAVGVVGHEEQMQCAPWPQVLTGGGLRYSGAPMLALPAGRTILLDAPGGQIETTGGLLVLKTSAQITGAGTLNGLEFKRS